MRRKLLALPECLPRKDAGLIYKEASTTGQQSGQFLPLGRMENKSHSNLRAELNNKQAASVVHTPGTELLIT